MKYLLKQIIRLNSAISAKEVGVKEKISNWKWWVSMLPLCLVILAVMAPFVIVRKTLEILLAIFTLVDISELREPKWFKSLVDWVEK